MGNLAADLDDRLRALERELELLAADRQRYAELFAQAPEALLVTDLHGTILEANQAADALLEGGKALRGKAIDDFVAMEQRRMFACHVRAALAGNGPARFPGKVRLGKCDLRVEFSVRALSHARLAWLVRRVS